jgi:hypothetical protein
MTLDAFQTARLAQGQATATTITEAAERAAREQIGRVRSDLAGRLIRARHEGARQAEVEMGLTAAREGRDARGLVLGAERDAYEALRAEVRTAALAIRQDPAYPRLLDCLERTARAQLGRDVRIERDPPEVGGLVATNDERRVDYSLPALGERCIGRLGQDVQRLWR